MSNKNVPSFAPSSDISEKLHRPLHPPHHLPLNYAEKPFRSAVDHQYYNFGLFKYI